MNAQGSLRQQRVMLAATLIFLALLSAALFIPLPEGFAEFRHVPVLTVLTAGASMAATAALHGRKWTLQQPRRLTLALVALYALAFSTLSILKHAAFNSTGFDLGIFDQTVWAYSNGENILNTVRGLVLLGDHAQPILFLLAPLYAVLPHVNTLLVVQSIALGAAAIPLYFIARKLLNDETTALLVAAAWLASPVLHYLNLFDFHPASLAALPLMMALYAMHTKSYVLLASMLALTALVKEHYALLLVTFGIFLIWRQKEWKWGSSIAVLGAAWFLFNVTTIIPSFSPQYQHLLGYGYLGTSFGDIFMSALTNPLLVATSVLTPGKLLYLGMLLLPFITALAAPATALIALPSFAINILRESTGFSAILYQHNIELLPFLFVAAVEGIRRLQSWQTFRHAKAARTGSMLLLLLSVSATISYGPFSTIYGVQTFMPDQHATAAEALIAQIPPDASVSASTWAVPHLTHRREAYMFPNPFYQHAYGPEYWMTHFAGGTTEYVLLDTTRQDPLMNASFQQESMGFVRSSSDYEQLATQDGWVLLRKK